MNSLISQIISNQIHNRFDQSSPIDYDCHRQKTQAWLEQRLLFASVQEQMLLFDNPYDLACGIFSMGYPPFEQAHYSDRCFRPLAKGDFNKFWKYHAGCSISRKCWPTTQSRGSPLLRSSNNFVFGTWQGCRLVGVGYFIV